VLAQQLIPRAGGKGRVLAMEVMIPNPAIRNLIREDKIQQIYSQMQVGQTKFAMQTMNQSLLSLVEHHFISLEDAMERSHNLDEFRQMLSSSNTAMGKRERPARTA
jgi:twitching motility protein PilT